MAKRHADKMPPYEIISSRTAVWVNDGSGCIGRFGKNGIDIHRTLLDQMNSGSECLACTHAPTTEADWQDFRRLMMHHYRIDVPDSARPGFLPP